MTDLRQVNLPDECNYVYLRKNIVQKTVGILTYLQCGEENEKKNALLQLYCQTINESAFNILRTQEKLGYFVSCLEESFSGVHGKKYF